MTNWLLALTVALGCGTDSIGPTPPPPPPPLPPPPPGVFPQLSAGFHPRQMQALGTTYKYQIFVPTGYTPSRTWPVVLYLHSSGGNGSDGTLQTSGIFGNWLRGAGANLQAVVVFPQYPVLSEGTCSNAPCTFIDSIPKVAVDSTLRQVRADSSRIYLTGWSLGGMVGWRLGMRRPGFFAAFMPLSSAVSPYWVFDQPVSASWPAAQQAVAQQLGNSLPIRMYQGGADELVGLLSQARATAQAFQANGTPLTYIELAGAPHNIEDRVYPDPAVWQWLFAQHR